MKALAALGAGVTALDAKVASLDAKADANHAEVMEDIGEVKAIHRRPSRRDKEGLRRARQGTRGLRRALPPRNRRRATRRARADRRSAATWRTRRYGTTCGPSLQRRDVFLDLVEPSFDGVVFEEAALARLARCRSRIEIHQPAGFEDDPTLVTTVELLLRAAGPSVFCKQRGFDLATSESTLRDLAGRIGLKQAINALDGVVDEPEPVADSDDAMTAEAVHRMLAAVAEHPPRRRRVGERLAVASAIVQELAGNLAQHGPRSDEAISKSTGRDIRTVAAARRSLAELLEGPNRSAEPDPRASFS